MYRYLPAFLLLLALQGYAQTNSRVSIISNGITNLKPVYHKTAGEVYDTVHVRITTSGKYNAKVADSNVVDFELKKLNLPNNPRLVNSRIFLPKEMWDTAGKSKDTTVILGIMSKKMKDTLEFDETGHITIKGQPDPYHTIRYTNSILLAEHKYDPTKPFWVEVGANFDLIDGLKPNNFFTGVFFHERDSRPFFRRDSNRLKQTLRKIDSKAKPVRYERIQNKINYTSDRRKMNNLGIFAGIFDSETVTNSQDNNWTTAKYFDSSSFANNRTDSILLHTGAGKYLTQRTVKNLSLFFSPQVRLTNGSANEDGLHFFTSLWAELQWQQIIETRTFQAIATKDSLVHIRTLDTFRYVGASKEKDIRSHYIGIGFPIYFRESTPLTNDLVQLLINPVIGFTNQATKNYLVDYERYELAQLSGKSLGEPTRKWNPFYIVQFRLNEEKYGIAFTGEVRGLLMKNNPPYVSLALTKKFDLTKFIEYNR